MGLGVDPCALTFPSHEAPAEWLSFFRIIGGTLSSESLCTPSRLTYPTTQGDSTDRSVVTRIIKHLTCHQHADHA